MLAARVPLLPDIRFCTAAGGAKIAVGSYGGGPPLVRAGTWLTHVEYEAASPLSAHWCEELARRHCYVTYDSRGCGLSDRQVGDLSLDVEPKLRFGPHVALMVMANMALAGARLPLSIFAKFRGDLSKWYPARRQLPLMLRIVSNRGGILRKAEELLKSRYSDALDASRLPSEPPIPEHQRSTTLAVLAHPGENLLEARE